MNTFKTIAFFIGFAVLFGGMFWLGSLAPVSKPDDEARKNARGERSFGNQVISPSRKKPK